MILEKQIKAKISHFFEELLTKENYIYAIITYNLIDKDIKKVRQGLKERAILEEYERKIEVLEFLSSKLKSLFYKQTYKDIEFYNYASTLRDNIEKLIGELKKVDNIFK